MKKLGLLLGAITLAVVGLTGCSKEITAEQGAAWAAENGYTKTSEIDYTGWAAKNNYVLNTKKALPAARLATKEEATADDYAPKNSGVQLVPGTDSKAAKALDYLGRDDIVYIDARDVASYNNGHIVGFEHLPYFDLVAPSGTGTDKLFTVAKDGTVTENYEESKTMMKKMLPEGKVMFLMCQSGGRIVNFMKVLKHCGYDMSKIYNIGGWLSVKDGDHNGYTVTYSNLTAAGNSLQVNFSGLTPKAA